MANHDCVTTGCNGKDLFGISLTCQICFKPCFLDCIKTRKEVVDLLDAYNINQSRQNAFSAQQQLVVKIKALFATNSVFEFVCVPCKSKGSRMDSQHEHSSELSDLKSKLASKDNDLANLTKSYNDVYAKLLSETSNANELSEKLQRANIQIRSLGDNIQQLNSEIDSLRLASNDLQSQVQSANGLHSNGVSSMETDQAFASTIASYNDEICNKLNQSISAMVASFENRIATECQGILNALDSDDHRSKRKKNTERASAAFGSTPAAFVDPTQTTTLLDNRSSRKSLNRQKMQAQKTQNAFFRFMIPSSKIAQRKIKFLVT